MKVYLAAQYQQKDEIRKYAAELQAVGVEVTSTWLEETHSPNTKMPDLSEDQNLAYAIADLEDIDRSDVVVLFTIEPTQPFVRGGRHFEFGYAYAKGKNVLICGPRENVFHHIPSIRSKTWPEIVFYLRVQSKIQAHVKNLQLEQSATVNLEREPRP